MTDIQNLPGLTPIDSDLPSVDNGPTPNPSLDFKEVHEFLNIKVREKPDDPKYRFRVKAKNYFLIYPGKLQISELRESFKNHGRIYEDVIIHTNNLSLNPGFEFTLAFVNYFELEPSEITNHHTAFVFNDIQSVIYVFSKKGTKEVKEWLKKADPTTVQVKPNKISIYDMINNCNNELDVLKKANKPSDVSGMLQAFNIVNSSKVKREDTYIKNYIPWGWQQHFLSKVDHDADERTILWYWSKRPEIGKSTMAYYLMSKFPDWFTVIPNLPMGKDAATIVDSALDSGWNGHCAMINLSMSYEKKDFFYSVLEQIKEPFKCSVKYKGKTRITGLTTVCVFANFPPQPYKWDNERNSWEPLIDPKRLFVFDILGPEFTNAVDPNPPRTFAKLNLFSNILDNRTSEEIKIHDMIEATFKTGSYYKPSEPPKNEEGEVRTIGRTKLRIVNKTTTITETPSVLNIIDGTPNVSDVVSNVNASIQEERKNPTKKKVYDPKAPKWYTFLNNKAIEEEDEKKLAYDPVNTRRRVLLTSGFNISDNCLIVCSQGENDYRKYAHFPTTIDFYSNYYLKLKSEEKTLYEVMTYGREQKLYFDLDAPLSKLSRNESYTLIKQIKRGIMDVEPLIKDSDIMIFNSHGPSKHSFHIVIDKWYVNSHEENESFARLVYDQVDPKLKPDGVIDFNVYKRNQQFRLYQSQKYGSGRVKVLDPIYNRWVPPVEEDSFEHLEWLIFSASLITNIAGCKCIPKYLNTNKPKVKYVGTEINEENYNKMIKVLDEKYPGSFSVKSQSSCGTSIQFRRLKPTYCNVCLRSHEHQNISLSLRGNNIHMFCFQVDKNKDTKTEIIGII